MSGAAEIHAFLGLGSNLGDRRAAIESAIDRLETLRGIRVMRRSLGALRAAGFF